MRCLSTILTSAIISFSTTCLASTKDYRKTDFITFLVGVGSRANYYQIAKKRNLIPPRSYLGGIGYRSHALSSTPIRINVEGIKHFGKQDSIELVLYPSIETAALHLGKIGLSWGIGNGVSAMVGPYPKFEKTKKIQSRRILNLFMIEQNIFLANKPELQFTLRWHHRCHLFNTIAPKGSGSNFLVFGIKHSF